MGDQGGKIGSVEPVILHESFERSEVKRLLAKFYKVRVVQSTEPHSIIFPKKSRAFLIKPICEMASTWPPLDGERKSSLDRKALQGLEKFLRIHRNSFVFLTTNQLTSDSMMVFSAIQMHFGAETNVTFYPASSVPQCIGMINDMIQPKVNYEGVLSEMQALREGKVDENIITNLLEKNIGISSHDAMVLQDGCKTLSNIARANTEDLLECSLSMKVANKIQLFFK